MTEQEQAQISYEAGLAAWDKCLPLVLGAVPDLPGESSAEAFVAAFLEAVCVTLVAKHGPERARLIMELAIGNAIEAYEEDPLTYDAALKRPQ